MDAGSGKYFNELKARTDSRKAIIAVVGVGYVGLPLAVSFAETGYKVVGYDVNKETVAHLQSGKSHISDVPSEAISKQIAAGRLSFTVNPSVLAEADAIFVCVPTPFTLNKRNDSRTPSPRAVDRHRIDDISRHHYRDRPSHPEKGGP
jgi:UDP-N-acetyl-D-glucosamine dehydrogenase